MNVSDSEKLKRYEWLCKAFNDAYHNDALGSLNPVSACLLHANQSYRSVQFVLNLQERTNTPINLDEWIHTKMEEALENPS